MSTVVLEDATTSAARGQCAGGGPYGEGQRLGEIRLAALPSAAGTARRFAQRMLRAWGLDRIDALRDAAELVTSELVTNAVRATALAGQRPGNDAGPRGHWPGLVIIRMLMLRGSLFVEVWDADPAPPAPRRSAADAESGRGLLLVAALSIAWNHYRLAAGGKVVWAELPARGR
jgi:hypothetical protein